MEVTHRELEEPKTEDLHVKVWPWLKEALERKAGEEGISVSTWTREQLIIAIANNHEIKG